MAAENQGKWNADILIVIANSHFLLPRGWEIKMEYSTTSAWNQLKIYTKKRFFPVLSIELRDITSIFLFDSKRSARANLKRIYSDKGHSFNNFVDEKLCRMYAEEVVDEMERKCFPEGKAEFDRKYQEMLDQKIAGEDNV